MGLLAWFAMGLGRGRDHLLIFFAATAFLFYGFRATLFVAGMDTPEPGQFFVKDIPHTLAVTLGTFVVFLGAAAIAFRTWFSLDGLKLPVFRRDEPDPRRMLRCTVALTALGSVVTFALLYHFGSPGEIVRAAKLSHGLAGLYVFKQFAALGAIVAAATVIDARRLRASRNIVTAGLVCMAADCYYVYLWGTRTIAVISIAIVVIGWRRPQLVAAEQAGDAPRLAKPRRSVFRYIVAGLLVLIVAMALRATREGTLNHGRDIAAENANIWRRMSLSLNATYLDASMLAVQDQDRNYHYPRGADFVSGAKSVVPGFIWHGKDTQTSGARFRHIYQPAIVNGWPVGAPTAWQLNFGPLGLLLGGYLSGMALAALARSRQRCATSGFNLAVSMVTATVVLQMGLNPDTPQRVILWWVPLVIVGRLMGAPPSRQITPSIIPSTRQVTARAAASV